MIKKLAPAIPLVLGFFIFELLIDLGWVQSYILPRPTEVLRSLIESRVELLSSLSTTLTAALIGLTLSFVLGFLIATLLSVSELAYRALYPYAVFFQTVPIIAIAPVMVIWFGFGMPTVIASAFIVSIFPMIASTLYGLRSTDPALLDLFHLYSRSSLRLLIKLRIPFALPQIFSGLRIAAGLAVIGAIVGEFVGGGGLGSVIDAARAQQRIDKVFAAVLISSLLGVFLVGGVNIISHLCLRRWHAVEKMVKTKT